MTDNGRCPRCGSLPVGWTPKVGVVCGPCHNKRTGKGKECMRKPTKGQIEEMRIAGGGICGHPNIDMDNGEPQTCPNCQSFV